MHNDFVEHNREFWSFFSAKDSNKKLLVEEPSSIPMIVHGNSIFSLILNQAKSLTPVWICNSDENIEMLKSYVPTAEFVSIPKASWLDRIKMKFAAIWKFMLMYITKDILSFSYDGVRYGDLVYDTYLTQEEVATIRKVDRRILQIIYACIRRHESIRRVLGSGDFEAVLVSHQVRIRSGVMLRAAIRFGYKGYLRVGHHQAALQCFDKLDEIYDYEYKPFPADIDLIIAALGTKFDKVYKLVFDRQVSGKGDKDGMYAFSPQNKYYQDRESFVSDFGLDPDKKIVFVMLHAFNDYPHSHFGWMMFRDYYDWFIETLKFARENDQVNWVFKQHPTIKLYTTKDVQLDSLFSSVPLHIIYIDENNQIDTRSLIHCSDLVVTCLGSAGFELPAMAAIPSLTAANSLYTGLGFALEPRTREEYFEILSNAQNIQRLTAQQQKRAQAAYMHIYEFSRVNVSACPIATAEQEKDKNQKSWYYDKVIDLYRNCGDTIKEQVNSYIAEVTKPGFKRLNSLRNYSSENSKRDDTRSMRIITSI